MSLSFEDSLKNNIVTVANDANLMKATALTQSEDYEIVSYASNENWQRHTGYVYYSSFSDDNISTINDSKDINLNSKQFNIT